MSDILLITTPGASTVGEQVRRLLEGHALETVAARELTRRLSATVPRPAVLLVAASSWSDVGRAELETIAEHAAEFPIVVVDWTLDTRLAHELIGRHGVQDYLTADSLSADRLNSSLELAVVRHGARLGWLRDSLIAARPELDLDKLREIARKLPAREREAFDLLVTCLPTVELANRLGKKHQTVLNQITRLKERFGVRSRDEVLVISMLCLSDNPRDA